MPGVLRNEKTCNGVKFYQSRNIQIRQLKHYHSPDGFGYRIWTSGWLLMDYLKTLLLPSGLRVMDVGCGWGLVGIYCAKFLQARVTSVDADPEVFPFLQLHAGLNQVEVSTKLKRFEDLSLQDLEGIDLLIGSDICFWDEMQKSVMALIDHAINAKIGLILISDPGREPFQALASKCTERYDAVAFNHSARRPHLIGGRILKICNHQS